MVSQTQVNIKRLVDNIHKTNAYTPLVEAIANSIDAITESSRKDGQIILTAYRSAQKTLGNISGDELKPFERFTVSDNGIGFTDKNLESFNTIYTDKKVREGGKGFGRFVFLKYFADVDVESVFNDKGVFLRRLFRFVKDNIIIQGDSTEKVPVQEPRTVVSLTNLKIEHRNRIDKKIETLSRKLLEKLLVYFVIDGFECPKITIVDAETGTAIVLNDLIENDAGISKASEGEFALESEDGSTRQIFKAKVFKIYYGESRSSITLVADKRQVTDEALHTYIPEFKDDFFETSTDEKGSVHRKNFTIKTYVQGRYLDDHVSLERDGFDFSDSNNQELFLPFNRPKIEAEAAKFTQKVFPEEIRTRQEKKEIDIRAYVDTKAPWHRSDLDELDRAKVPYNASESQIEAALEEVRFNRERKTRNDVIRILAETDESEVVKQAEAIIEKLNDFQKNELAHYVAIRRAILNLFKKSLSWGDDKKYEKEQVIHDILFPRKATSDSIEYSQHNLWLIDEKLSFTEYVASDKPLNSNDERPDILVFDNPVVMRDGDTPSHPIIIFELKKPQRTEYGNEENPLTQLSKYVEKIRKGDFKNPEGRDIYANENTPAYAYLICDLTPKVREMCEVFGLIKSPDNRGYFGFHPNFKIYYQVIAFDKLAEDSELRNAIFFKKLGIS